MATRPAAPAIGKPFLRDTGIPYSVVLSELVAGKSRFDIVAAHPELVPDDIPLALTLAEADLDDGRLPEITRGGTPLSAAEISALQPADEVADRWSDLLRRWKRCDLTAAERAEFDDVNSLEHVMILAKAKAKLVLRSAG